VNPAGDALGGANASAVIADESSAKLVWSVTRQARRQRLKFLSDIVEELALHAPGKMQLVVERAQRGQAVGIARLRPEHLEPGIGPRPFIFGGRAEVG